MAKFMLKTNNLFITTLLRIFYITLIFPSSSAFTQENNIVWQTDHRPSASILTGKYKGQGYIDTIRATIISNTPQYRHQQAISSVDTLFDDMKKQKSVCHPLLFVTEKRKELAYFSIPVTITPSIRIVIKANRADSLKLKEPIDLTQFIRSRATYTIVKGRSYGEYIDNILTEQNAYDNHVKISVADNTTLFKLLERDRVDFTFAYPFEATF